MSQTTSTTASAPNSSLAARVDQLTQQIGKHEAAMNRSASTMGIVGIIALVLLSGYFFYGYKMISELLEPKTLIPLGAQMLRDRLPEARNATVQLVSDSAPKWADDLSVQAQNSIPKLRTKLEEYVIEQTDKLLGEVTTVTEAQFRKTIQENHDLLDKGFKELATSDKLSEESLKAIEAALEQQLQADMKAQSELVLETLRHLRSRAQRLLAGNELDEEERIERRVLMLSRRLQLMEADPRPIQMPALSKAADAKPAENGDQAKDSAADETPPKTDKPAESKDPQPADEKQAAEPPAEKAAKTE